jgi:hypothetical protein
MMSGRLVHRADSPLHLFVTVFTSMMDSQPIPRCHCESGVLCRVKQSLRGSGNCFSSKVTRLVLTGVEFGKAVACLCDRFLGY